MALHSDFAGLNVPENQMEIIHIVEIPTGKSWEKLVNCWHEDFLYMSRISRSKLKFVRIYISKLRFLNRVSTHFVQNTRNKKSYPLKGIPDGFSYSVKDNYLLQEILISHNK
jgi:hypothetical protein